MNNYQFAKLFNFNEGQLLVTKAFNEDDENYEIRTETRIIYNGAVLTISHIYGYEEEEKRDENFDSFSDENAMKLFNACLSQATELIPETDS